MKEAFELALITKFDPRPSDSVRIHEPVEAGVRSFTVGVETYFVLETYGRADRQFAEK